MVFLMDSEPTSDSDSVGSLLSDEFDSEATTIACDDILDHEMDDIKVSDLVELNISMDSGIEIDCSFTNNTTVTKVIESIDYDSDYDYEISWNHRVIPRAITLRDAGVPSGSKVRMIEQEFQIFIRLVDGRNVAMNARSSETIKKLKEKFFYTNQVPVHQQRLIYEGKECVDDRTLKSYKIRRDSHLQMLYRLRGGNALQI